MKKTFKKLLAGALAFMLAAGVMPVSARDASDDLYISINGELIPLEADEVIIDDENELVYVPFGIIVEELGSKVKETEESVYAEFEDGTVTIIKDTCELVATSGTGYLGSRNQNPVIYDKKADEYYFDFNIFMTLFGCWTGWDEEERVLVVISPDALSEYVTSDMTFENNDAITDFMNLRNGKTHKVSQTIVGVMPYNGKTIKVNADLEGYVRDSRLFDVTCDVTADDEQRTIDFRSDMATGILYAREDGSDTWVEQNMAEMDDLTSSVVFDIQSLIETGSFETVGLTTTRRNVDINDAFAWYDMAAELERNIIRNSDKAYACISTVDENFKVTARDYVMTSVNPVGHSMIERLELRRHVEGDVTTSVTMDIEIAYYDEATEKYIEMKIFVYDQCDIKIEAIDVYSDGERVRSIVKTTEFEEADVEIEYFPAADEKVVDRDGNPVEVKPAFTLQINGVDYNKNSIPLAFENDTMYVDLSRAISIINCDYFAHNDVVDMIVEDGAEAVTYVYGDGTTKDIALEAPVFIDPFNENAMVPISAIDDLLEGWVVVNYDEDEYTVIIVQYDALLKTVFEGMSFNLLESAYDLQHRLDDGKWTVSITRDESLAEDAVEGAGFKGLMDSETGNFELTFVAQDADSELASIGIRGDYENDKYYLVIAYEGEEIWVEVVYEDYEDMGALNIKELQTYYTDVLSLLEAASLYIGFVVDYTDVDDWDRAYTMARSLIKPLSDEELAQNNYKAYFSIPEEIVEYTVFDEYSIEIIPTLDGKNAKSVSVTRTQNATEDSDSFGYVTTTHTYDNTYIIKSSMYEGEELVRFDDAVIKYAPTKESPEVVPGENALVFTTAEIEELIEALEEEAAEEEVTEEEAAEEEVTEEEAAEEEVTEDDAAEEEATEEDAE